MANASLCFTGFSREELAQVQQQFEQANESISPQWTLAPEADARVLVIDMDSMYGHMTWLKASGSGKTTVGVTAGERCETDYMLKRPFDVAALRNLLATLAEGSGGVAMPAPRETAPPAPPVVPTGTRNETPEPSAQPSGAAQAAAIPVDSSVPEAVDSGPQIRPSADYIAAITTGQMAAMPANPVPHQSSISDLLAPGQLAGPTRFHIDGAPAIVLDPASQTYAGTATLKPLIPYVEANLTAGDGEPVTPADFEALKVASGGAQPYIRLAWLCGLTLGQGQLLPGFTPARKFQLTKWPQIEREYPKHFRLATVMMKGPALAKDIAEAAGVPVSDVTDFINAGLVTGAVVVDGSDPVGGDIARASALLARPRGR
jgi:hypothetical protein